MFISYFRTCMFICLIATGFLGTIAHAIDKFSIRIVEDVPLNLLPVDIAKMCGLLTNAVADTLGGYEKCIKQGKLIPLSDIDAQVFHEIIEVLLWAKLELEAKDLTRVLESTLQDTLEKKLAHRTSKELLDMLTLANYLDIKIFLNAAAKMWAKNYSTVKSDFEFLNKDLKERIIGHLGHHQFLALAKVNDYREEVQQEIFSFALGVHHDEKPKPGKTAREFYKELVHGKFVFIPGADYVIGTKKTETNRYDNEKLCQVTLDSFWIMATAVTQEQYAKKMHTNPSFYKEKKHCPTSFKIIEVNGKNIEVCSDHPVHRVNWYEAYDYAKKLSEDDPEYDYFLPEETQLEIAFKGGQNTAFVCGDDASKLGDYVWYSNNSGNHTHPVDSKIENDLGVHRSGVWEWAKDWYCTNFGEAETSWVFNHYLKVLRGGSIYDDASACRSAVRKSKYPYNKEDSGAGAFRLVRKKKKI